MEEEETVNPSEPGGFSPEDIVAIEKGLTEKIRATVKIEGKFPWEITFEFGTLESLTENLAKIEIVLGEAIGLGVQPQVTPSSTPETTPSEEEAPTGEHPMCDVHKQSMDKTTKKGVPYHSYKGKNCSGEGWWGQR